MNSLKKIFIYIKPFDIIIFLLACIIVMRIDFNNVDIIDVVYLATFVLWFGQLIFRILLIRKKQKQEKQ